VRNRLSTEPAVRPVQRPEENSMALDDDQWWFNLRTQQVEQGLGDPNTERLGPYATREEAEGVLERMHRRTAEFDAQDDD
jgi:hypothetical protein